MLGRLPLALLSLLFATVAHSAEPTTPNDQFRQIVLRIPQKPEPPICCLKSPQPLEVVDDELLLSFEEWKAKQAQEQGSAHPDAPEKAHKPGSETEPNAERIRNGDDPSGTQNEMDPSANASSEPRPPPKKALSPHFSIPITDRFNYASLDCSARVHEAHRGAKSASSILSSKKDRYMLSPCKTSGPQFVVVELCEDIRIDTVQLANFEFFSGVFKDFSVSVAKTYNGPYQDAGLYRAKNIRGVQSFHTTTLSDFYRYIRIDFHSHYGKEHYCPLSLLRVYGLTHLEKWKWELWEAEGGARLGGATKIVSAVVESPIDLTESSLTLAVESTQLSTIHVSKPPATPDPSKPILMGPAAPLNIVAESLPSPSIDTHPTLFVDTDTQLNDHYDPIQISHMQTLHTKDSNGSPSTSLPPLPSSTVLSTTAPSPSRSVSLASAATETTPSTASVKPASSQASPDAAASISSTRSAPVPAPSPSMASANLSVPPSHAPPTTSGGESIYRTIMNRLNAVESNHTLYVRYIDQQNGAIRNVIKQLGEDIGRLEAITRSQRATYQKSMGQWERERMQMIMDYNQLRSKVDHLTEEIVLEKRLGVFQLCLLLAVLVFMGLTRGSRGEPVVVTGPAGTVREWGRRHLSLSGDWGRFVRRSVSRSPARAKPATSSPSKGSAKLHPDDKIHFPRSDPEWKKTPFEQIQLNTAPLPHEYRAARQKKNSVTRSRTPSLRTGANAAVKRTPQTAVPQRSGTPTPIRMAHLRPQLLQRSSSHGTHSSFFPGGMVPKSAKKWARTAHLHPAKPAPGRDGARAARDENTFSDGNDDVFSAPAGTSGFPRLDKDSVARLPNLSNPGKQKAVDQRVDGDQRGGVGDGEKGGRVPLRMLSYSGDDRDNESNWADTDSLVGSDAGDGNYSDVDGQSGLE